MLRSDWLSYYKAICISPLVPKSAGFLAAKKELKSLTLGVGQLWVHMFPWKKWLFMIYERNHLWTAEMKMKTKWSSQWTLFANVSGFIAQLVEHHTGNREVTGSNPVEVLNFFQASLRNCINCVHCDDHFFIFISFPQFIYDLFYISLTLKFFYARYFWPTSWILLKQLFPSSSWPLSQ